jgi:predicted phage terminase large subunit-like protein
MDLNLNAIPDEVLREILQLTELQAKQERQQRVHDSFMAFAHHVYEGFIEGAHHRIIAEKLEQVARGELKRLIINMPPRHALDIKEKVLTTDGWKTIETLQVGDFVYGPDGLPTEVLGKSDVFEDRDLFAVRTDDGCEVACDGEHIWTVRLDRKYKSYQDYTTEQLFAREQGAFVRTKRSGQVEIREDVVDPKNVRAAMLPAVSPVVRPEANLPVDPYVLGIWLGDGAAAQTTFTASDEDAKWIRAEFERRGYTTKDRATSQTFGVDDLKVPLRDDLGVLGNKHIPESYLLSSVEQRMDLLRGLMDSDGNVTKDGQCFFTQKDPVFIHSVRKLLWSLGIKNTTHSWAAKLEGRDYGPAYRLSFYAKDCCLLPRKRERTRAARAGRFIRVSKLERRGPTQCIRVAREDGLFLVGEGLVTTHNSKSEFASYLMPAWFLGRNPKLKIIQATHNTELAVRFGRKVRDLIEDPQYQEVFPNTKLKEDNKGAGKWGTTAGAEYFAAGVGAAVTGRGADLFIIDDPHSEQDALSDTAFDHAYEWYTSGPRQRLQPGGAIILVMTRWGKKDLTGRLLEAQSSDPMADQWEVVEFPAILPSGEPLWPEFWEKNALLSIKASLPVGKWSAQWQQQPTSTEQAIVKREWWRDWEKEKVPELKYILQAYDTAFSKKETADYSAITTWGVFEPDEGGKDHVILLDAKRGRWSFPELKEVAWEECEYWDPDMVIVEAKASGRPLIDEMRTRGIPAVGFSPGRKAGGGGIDKTTRMHTVSPLFEAGMVWAPLGKKFADEVIEEVASFPNGEHDDFVDSMTLALMRFRQGGFIAIHDEELPEETMPRKREYY